MSLTADLLLLASIAYVAILFGVAFWADRRAQRRGGAWLSSPLIYTLSISVYCTSWTFYGAVGTASRGGFDFIPIYLGPTLVFVGWWALLQKLVRIGRRLNVTSIADFLSARFGKSAPLAAGATIVAVMATLPYVSLQIRAIASSYHLVVDGALQAPQIDSAVARTALYVSIGMAAFTILFGTRTIDSQERHHGVVAAIALEAVVKLAALVGVGLFAVYGLSDGFGDVFAKAPPELIAAPDAFDARFVGLLMLSGIAVICLPRQFQVTVVECEDERHGRTAAWAFPVYLFAISLFVLPIALVGLNQLPAGADPDLFVLTLPLAANENALGLLAFLGGFSSATSMVIISCIALSTMVSNHLVMPLWFKDAGGPAATGDVQTFLLRARRLSICAIMGLAFLYFRLSGDAEGLASIGLISFVGVAQLAPGVFAALFWPRATERGVMAGLIGGFILWAYTLLLPSLDHAGGPPPALFDLALLRPDALLGLTGFDPLLHGMAWSLGVNIALLVVVSAATDLKPLERIQGALFLDASRGYENAEGDRSTALLSRSAASSDLFVLAQRILGSAPAHRLFAEFRTRQGGAAEGLPAADGALIVALERRLAANVGAASAHAMVSRVTTGERVSLEALMEIADEHARIRSYAQQLEQKSQELSETAEALRQANARLTEIDAQKDAFLSQVSHELRTPMTSLRAFAEILLSDQTIDREKTERFLSVIHQESLRLTRLLDQILDIGQLERGGLEIKRSWIDPEIVIGDAVASAAPQAEARQATIHRSREDGDASGREIFADPDRLQQVMLNLVANSIKYNTSAEPEIWIETRWQGEHYEIDVSDNGPGVPDEAAERIFERFSRAVDPESRTVPAGVGLGLAICREILAAHGGGVRLAAARHGGATFTAWLPVNGAPR